MCTYKRHVPFVILPAVADSEETELGAKGAAEALQPQSGSTGLHGDPPRQSPDLAHSAFRSRKDLLINCFFNLLI